MTPVELLRLARHYERMALRSLTYGDTFSRGSACAYRIVAQRLRDEIAHIEFLADLESASAVELRCITAGRAA